VRQADDKGAIIRANPVQALRLGRNGLQSPLVNSFARAVRLLRLLKIFIVIRRYGLDLLLFEHERATGKTRALLRFLAALQFWRHFPEPRAVRLRQALEALGPLFVKFGQVLSTRRDLLPTDIADELAKLQDQVPAFPPRQVMEQLEAAYGNSAHEVFAAFDPAPVASASVAQVHFATLHDGREVAVKILRPGIESVIAHDLALLHLAASMMELLWPDGRRLKPHEVIAEFERHLADELDLMCEASNCSQLRRNFLDSPLLLVPEVYWDWCNHTVMVMERVGGTPISQIDELRARGVDLKALARAGVEIFFTQVFRDGFFHADMHPGNIFVVTEGSEIGRYVAVDFGIVGTLTDSDKSYLAQNFLAFFRRDYKRVALTHIESGWAPAQTPVAAFESAIRAVCEPIFDRPLKDISIGRILLRLFQTSRRFNVEIQPQLVLLQKTLLNIEGLGRQLDPELDLWSTAKPFLERWMSEQLGWRGLIKSIKHEAPKWAQILPQLPRLLHSRLNAPPSSDLTALQLELLHERSRSQRLLLAVAALAALLLVLLVAK